MSKSGSRVSDDEPTRLTSKVHGANLDTIIFNIDLIARKDPNLAVQIMQMYGRAKDIKPSDVAAPEEDFALALKTLASLHENQN